MLPLEPPHPTAEREAGDARVRDDADRADEPDRLRLPVELAESAPPLTHAVRSPASTRAPFIRERSITIPSSQVERPGMLWPPLRTAIGSSSSRAKRTAATTSSGGRGPDDERRVAVDHPVPDDARGVVAGVAAADDLAGEGLVEAGPRAHVLHRYG